MRKLRAVSVRLVLPLSSPRKNSPAPSDSTMSAMRMTIRILNHNMTGFSPLTGLGDRMAEYTSAPWNGANET
ncbi:MAG: hypothetical protein BMS9Abin26_1451 [Gammaproteobacteria bacterium]|nr:MAG: hypothetical protein BMS9Abin26_1451 [Gammaproteobacteria bacterium]